MEAPTLDQVRQECVENEYLVNPVRFFKWQTEHGWKGVRDWKAILAAWDKRDRADMYQNRRREPVKPDDEAPF